MELCHLLCFVCGRASTRQPPGQRGSPSHTSCSQASTIFFQAQPGKQRAGLARQPCRSYGSTAFEEVQAEIEAWAAWQAHAWNCAIYFASEGSASTRQPPGQRGSLITRSFQAGGSLTRQAKADLARQPCRSYGSTAFQEVEAEIEAWAAWQAHVLNSAIYFALFVGATQAAAR